MKATKALPPPAPLDEGGSLKFSLEMSGCDMILLANRDEQNTRALLGSGTLSMRYMNGMGQSNVDIGLYDMKVWELDVP
jgi:hypothetical protein